MASSLTIWILMAVLSLSGVNSKLVAFRNFGGQPTTLMVEAGRVVEYSPGMTSAIACARLCLDTRHCESYLWDRDGQTCLTQPKDRSVSVSGLPAPRPAIKQPVTLLYSRTVRCDPRLGYEIRIRGITVLCVLLQIHTNATSVYYKQAKAACEELEGVLVKANTRDKMDIVIGLYNDSVAIEDRRTSDCVATSLNSKRYRGKFVWRDGQALTTDEKKEITLCPDQPFTGWQWGLIWVHFECYDDVQINYYRSQYEVCEMITE